MQLLSSIRLENCIGSMGKKHCLNPTQMFHTIYKLGKQTSYFLIFKKIELQAWNGCDLGRSLYSRISCANTIDRIFGGVCKKQLMSAIITVCQEKKIKICNSPHPEQKKAALIAQTLRTE